MSKKLVCVLLSILLLIAMFSLSIQAYATGTDGDSMSNSSRATGTPLKITTQPKNVAYPKGVVFKLRVEAQGDGLTYKWYYKNKTASTFSYTSSFKGNTYSVEMTAARDGRQVYCVITDKYGNSVKTNTVTMHMSAPVKITSQPKSVNVAYGDSFTVKVGAQGDGLKYKWYFKNKGSSSFIYTPTFKGNTYSTTMNSSRDGRQVYCKITDKYGNTVKSEIVTLSMTKPVKISKQPQSVTVEKGDSVKITLKASGSGLSYKWYYKDPGQTSFTYTKSFKSNVYNTTMTSARAGRQVYCVVTDKYGNSVKSEVATLNMVAPVKITVQPQSVAVKEGETAKVSFTAVGDGLSYKWYYKNKTASSFTYTSTFKSNTYTTEMNATRSGRQIYCKVTDKYGNTVTTDTVTLNMGTPVKITKQPVSVAAPKGEMATVTVGAAGDGLTYKWYFKDAGKSSFSRTGTFKGNTYSVEMNATRDGRQVYCIVTDKYGVSVKTDVVTISMPEPVKITAQPKDVMVGEGKTAKTSVTATGDGLKYQWFVKNPGSSSFTKSAVTSKLYSVKMNESISGRQVYCQITDLCGNTVKTKTVTLTMGSFVKISAQPMDAAAPEGSTATVVVSAVGDGLTYKWYFKERGHTKFQVTNSFKGNTYSVEMNSARDGRQVYCVVTDRYGNTVKSNTVTLTAYTPMKIVTQPASVTVAKNDVVAIAVEATGEGLTYKWYYKDAGKSQFQLTKAFTSNTYALAMNDSRDGRQVYCKISDKYGNTVSSDVATMTMRSTYTITVDKGVGDDEVIGVSASGKYSLTTPSIRGYTFKGWVDSNGKSFSSSGTIRSNVKVKAVWTIDGTNTLQELVDRTNAGVEEIKITANITLNKPIFINYDTKIYSDSSYSLKRDPNYAGDLFVVGQDQNGVIGVLEHRKPTLTLGNGKGTLTIDGNRSKTKVNVVGSAVLVSDSAILNLYDGIKIANNKKVGNERLLTYSYFAGSTAVKRAGGAAIINLNATVNMYGGVIDNNLVATEPTYTTDDTGAQVYNEFNGCGGAVYNCGNFNMYGGTISNSEALRGGGMYTDRIVYLEAGTISGNLAHAYGGGVASSSSMNADTFIGTEGSGATMLFSNNHCKGTGGALYSNTSSPIIIYGNAKFTGNSSDSSGGAIYTAGPLTARNAIFSGNSCVSSGGAIYHHYTKATFERRHLTLTNCTFENNKSNLGGAVILSSTSTAAEAGKGTIGTIENCTFTGNQAVMKNTSTGNGAAIYITKKSEATIKGCTFTENAATGNAGAVAIQSESKVNLSDSTFTNNTALHGGALYATEKTVANLTNVTFTGNNATVNANGGAGLGGAMYLDRASVTFKNVDARDNTAGVHGGAGYLKAITLNLNADSEFTGNSAGQHGGVFYLTYQNNSDNTKTGAVVNATGTNFSGNSAMAGGAISVRSACEVTLKDAKLVNNSVTGFADKNDGDGDGGGAIYVGYGKATLNNVTATGNTASDFGGVVDAVSSTVTIKGGTFTGNKTNSGGVVYAKSGSTLSISGAKLNNNESLYVQTGTFNSSIGGGAININGGTLTVESTTMDGNKSGYYGGTLLASKSTVTIQKNTVVSGSSGATGAALYFNNGSTVTLKDTSVTDNTSNGNGVLYINGGSLDVTNVTATGNKAANGGVLYTSGASTLVTLKNSAWNNNSATSTGGAINQTNATVKLSDVEMKNNTAKHGGAIVNQTGTLEIKNVNFVSNKATSSHGGAISLAGGTLTATGTNNFSGNTAAKNGGAVNLGTHEADDEAKTKTFSTFTMTGGTFTKNSGGTGGAVYASTGSTVSLADVPFTENTSTGNGGALYIYDNAFTASNLDFSKNTATGHGGALYLCAVELDMDSDWTFTENSAGQHGGAVYLTYKTNEDKTKTGAVLNATDVIFNGNSAMGGGAISARTACEVELIGGQLINNSVTGYQDDGKETTTNDNDGDGEGGGAIYVGYGKATLTNVTATGNTASDFGGVIDAVASPVTVTGGTFSGNKANNGGVIHAMSNSTVFFDGTTLKENESPYVNSEYNNAIGGGAIHTLGGTLNITKSTLDGNKSGWYGGAVHTSKTTVNISDNTVITNSVGATGAALHCFNGSQVTMENVSVLNNNSSYNSVLYQGGGTLTMNKVTASGNKAVNGGVLYTSGSSTVITLTNSTWSENTATTGGVIYMKDATVKLTNSLFKSNTANKGGAVYNQLGTLEITDATFDSNSATSSNGGAIELAGGTLTATGDNRFTGNTAAKLGGAVNVGYFEADDEVKTKTYSTFTMTGGAFTKNSGGTGGAVYATTGATVTLKDVPFTENSSTGNGGALYIFDNAFTASNLDFVKNSATGHGGALYLGAMELDIDSDWTFTENSAGQHGGAVYLTYKTNADKSKTGAVLNATNVIFDGNSAMAGGAISARTACEVELIGGQLINNSVTGYAGENDGDGEGGGAIYVGFGEVKLNNVTATGNTASDFGGVVDAMASPVTVTGGTFSGNSANSGGVIHAMSDSTVTFDGTTLKENESPYIQSGEYISSIGGGAIHTVGGKLNITATTLDGNKSGYYGGAIHTNKTTVKIDGNSAITNSSGATGAACYFTGNSVVTMENTSVTNNTSNGNGVLYILGTATVDNVAATGNKAGSGGVLYASGANTNVTVKNISWSGNSASQGGTIYLKEGATVNLANVTMKENSASQGGAVFAYDAAKLNLNGTIFQKNSATAEGGAIYTRGATITSTDTTDVTNTFTGNTATNHGGAIYVNYIKGEEGQTNVSGVLNMTGGLLEGNSATAGGAISSRTSCVVTLTGTTFKNNSATGDKNYDGGGGAIYSNSNTLTLSGVTFDGNSTAFYGGAVSALGVNATITDNTKFTNNTGATGPAIHLRDGGTTVLTDAIVTNNIGTDGNGAIYYTGGGSLSITNLTASGNTNSNGGVLYNSGSGTVTITNSSLTGNIATANGGVIDHRGSGTLTITGTTISGNSAKNGGAVYTSGKGNLSIVGSQVTSNSATGKGGAIYATGSGNVTVSNSSSLNSNTAPTAGAVYVDQGATVTINDSTLDGNSATGGVGGAIVVTDSSKEGTAATTLNMTGTTLKNNTATDKGGALSTEYGKPNLVINATNCTFSGNKSTGAGGGAVEIQSCNCNSATDPTAVSIVFTGCSFTGNTAKSTGGAIEIRSNSCAKLVGITATGNKAGGNGGVIYVTSNYSRLYLTGDVTQSDNTSNGGKFIHLYHDGNYSNPPKLYTTYSESDADWYANVDGDKGNRANVAFGLPALP